MHVYSGTPGRKVWAQWQQTNRPSLWAIIGLKSMPAMQWGQRMVRIVSVGNGYPATSKRNWHAGSQSSRIDIEPHPPRDLGRRADGRADQADDENLQP